jgi:hypothetical protein
MILKLPYYRPARMPTLRVAVTRATPIGRICRSFRQLGVHLGPSASALGAEDPLWSR